MSFPVTEAIILAGGFGTRLRSVVQELPKCMALVDGKPFLEHIIMHLEKQGIQRIILSVGYKREIIINYFSQRKIAVQIDFCEEDTPLGTGGAVAKAMRMCTTEHILVANGDTFYAFDLMPAISLYSHTGAHVVMYLKPMFNFERYGVVECIQDTNRIIAFKEKQFTVQGNINAGVYLMRKDTFLSYTDNKPFSLEKDFFEKYVAQLQFFSIIQDCYFIDIGIPEDYNRAKRDLAMKRPFAINKNTTLFIDRDGVINEERPNDYVKKWSEFVFYPYTLTSLEIVANVFAKIILVTNQKGVPRQLMSMEDLTDIHTRMVAQIEKHGGRIDKIYASTALDADDYSRKPNPGMALEALLNDADIDLQNSIIIGNSLSDMEFGKNAGMHTIFVHTTKPTVLLPHAYIDMQFPTLYEAVRYLQGV